MKLAKPVPDEAVRSGLTPVEWGIVRSCPVFAGLPNDIAIRLVGARRPTSFEAGQVIFSHGDAARAFFVVVEGWVKLFRVSPEGQEAVLRVFTAGESFAEPVMFLGGVYPAHAEAASRARLLRIESADFLTMIRARPALSGAMLAAIAEHTDRLSGDIAGLKLLAAPRRLAEFLVRLAPKGAREADVILPHEKGLLAGRLGMTPESLSRALASLRKIGVEAERDRIRIADLPALAQFASQAGRAAKRKPKTPG